MEYPGSSASDPIDLTNIIKSRLVWDIFPHDEVGEWLDRLGLVPPAEESFELEHRAAHARAERIIPLAVLGETYAELLAEMQGSYIRHVSEGEIPEDKIEAFIEQAFQVSRVTLLAILTEFIDEGYLAYGPKRFTVA